MNNKPIDIIGYLLLATLSLFLVYGGYLSYKSIDYDILKKLEAQPLVLPTPIPASPSASLTTQKPTK